jgi:hypothetical protein
MFLWDNKIILRTMIAVGFCLLGAELYFYYFNFDHLLKERVFVFGKKDYINYWLLIYIVFALLLRLFGLVRFVSYNQQGFREYSFGQLMLIALLCKEFFRYVFYIYQKPMMESGNWRTVTYMALLFVVEVGMLFYFYMATRKMSET